MNSSYFVFKYWVHFFKEENALFLLKEIDNEFLRGVEIVYESIVFVFK
jgi:hypothetical protein